MAKRSGPTHAIHMAHRNLTEGFARAHRRTANIPLGKEELDPRTVERRRQALAKGLANPIEPGEQYGGPGAYSDEGGFDEGGFSGGND